MKKLSILALSAATVVMVGAMPIVSQAAMNTYNISGGRGKVIVIGGNSASGLKNLLGQNNCNQFFPNWGGSNIPDNSLPEPILPGPDDSEDGGGQLPPADDSTQNTYAQQVVNLVNEERAKAGLAPLTLDTRTASAAQTRAREIETSFSHTRPNGSGFETALAEAGVSYRRSGENIAYGQRSPEEVMQGWMNSAGHRANILNANFTSIGVGHYQSASGVNYWTQLFIQ